MCYGNRTRRIQDKLVQILGDCVDKNELEEDGFKYIIDNEDLTKNALTFIEMLQLRLQYQVKVNLADLDNTDSFHVHGKKEKESNIDREALDDLSKFLYLTCPINQQRKIMSAIHNTVPETKKKLRQQMY